MTQRDLADAADIPQPDIPAIERGERDVRLSTANRIARALNTMLRDLLPGRWYIELTERVATISVDGLIVHGLSPLSQ
jgi:predicted transcriptional regulator